MRGSRRRPRAEGPTLGCVGCALVTDVLADAMDALNTGAGDPDHAINVRASPLLDARRAELGAAYVSVARATRQILKLIEENALSVASDREDEVRVTLEGAQTAVRLVDAAASGSGAPRPLRFGEDR